jgi:hypothetical protein
MFTMLDINLYKLVTDVNGNSNHQKSKGQSSKHLETMGYKFRIHFPTRYLETICNDVYNHTNSVNTIVNSLRIVHC